MPAGVVNDLELVKVEIQQRVPHALGLRTLQGQFQPALELTPVQQTGQAVVGCLIGNFRSHFAGRGDIMKHQHDADDLIVLVEDRCGGIFYRTFGVVASTQHGVIGQTADFPAL